MLPDSRAPRRRAAPRGSGGGGGTCPLLQTGQIFEGAKGESKRGRRPTHLYIDTRTSCALAVDISASRTSMLLTDLLGRPLGDVTEFPTRRRPATQVKELVAHIGLILANSPGCGQCVGIGVAVSGIVDERGRLTSPSAPSPRATSAATRPGRA